MRIEHLPLLLPEIYESLERERGTIDDSAYGDFRRDILQCFDTSRERERVSSDFRDRVRVSEIEAVL